MRVSSLWFANLHQYSDSSCNTRIPTHSHVLNDDFMHPNPDFTYRDTNVRDRGQELFLEMQYFDVISDIHNGHLLAYLNLLDLILWASESLMNNLYGSPHNASNVRNTFAEAEASRAADLAIRNTEARKVMEELGLWRFKSIA